MSVSVPLRVPVEIRRGERWFRLAHQLSVTGLELGGAIPEALEGPLALAFHLPGDAHPIRCQGVAEELVVDEGHEAEHAERRALRFLDLQEADRGRIERYVEERLASFG